MRDARAFCPWVWAACPHPARPSRSVTTSVRASSSLPSALPTSCSDPPPAPGLEPCGFPAWDGSTLQHRVDLLAPGGLWAHWPARGNLDGRRCPGPALAQSLGGHVRSVGHHTVSAPLAQAWLPLTPVTSICREAFRPLPEPWLSFGGNIVPCDVKRGQVPRHSRGTGSEVPERPELSPSLSPALRQSSRWPQGGHLPATTPRGRGTRSPAPASRDLRRCPRARSLPRLRAGHRPLLCHSMAADRPTADLRVSVPPEAHSSPGLSPLTNACRNGFPLSKPPAFLCPPANGRGHVFQEHHFSMPLPAQEPVTTPYCLLTPLPGFQGPWRPVTLRPSPPTRPDVHRGSKPSAPGQRRRSFPTPRLCRPALCPPRQRPTPPLGPAVEVWTHDPHPLSHGGGERRTMTSGVPSSPDCVTQPVTPWWDTRSSSSEEQRGDTSWCHLKV